MAANFFYENHNLNIKNHKGYETKEIFNVDENLDDNFWEKYFKEYSLNVESRKFAAEVIKKLKESNNEIYIITARGNFLSHSAKVMSIEENQTIVIKWLEKNNIYYDKLIFSSEDKLELCKQNKIDLMIEDKPRNIDIISTKIPVICFHANYNEKCSGDNIYRCYSWYDILYKIEQLKNKE